MNVVEKTIPIKSIAADLVDRGLAPTKPPQIETYTTDLPVGKGARRPKPADSPLAGRIKNIVFTRLRSLVPLFA